MARDVTDPQTKVSIVDLTHKPYRIIGQVDGPGHGMNWFRSGGREYVLHSNEGGTAGIMGQPQKGDPCQPYPHPTSLFPGAQEWLVDTMGHLPYETRKQILQTNPAHVFNIEV